jgi:hypothetical protein
VVGAQKDFDKDSPLRVVKVLDKKALTVPAQAKKKINIGKHSFVSTDTVKGNTMWRSGMVYEGYMLEVFLGENLVFEDRKGGSDVKKIVQRYRDKKSK